MTQLHLPLHPSVAELSLSEGPPQYPNELPGILVEGRLRLASCFSEDDFERICREKRHIPQSEMGRILQAYDLNARLLPDNRRTGEPYRHHPEAVALIGMLEFDNEDPDLVVAALLHDVLEDAHLFREDRQGAFGLLSALFGERVAKIVSAVTKPVRIFKKESASTRALHDYMVLAYQRVLSLYPEVAAEAARVKIWDRIHNLRTEPDPSRLALNVGATRNHFPHIAVQAGQSHQVALDALLTDLERRLKVGQERISA